MDVTNELQQSLLDAMDLIGEKVAESTKAPMTIKAQVIELLDEGSHQYKISYGGAKYTDAYSISNASYDPDTMVFVLIPDNDFDNPKIILNAVDPAASDYADEELSDIYVPISDNLITESVQLDLKSWLDAEGAEAGSVYPIVHLAPSSKPEFGTVFKDYITKYKTFVLSAKIKTEIDEEHQVKGNYGLKLRLPFLQKNDSEEEGATPIIKDFVMDVNNILGNPYDFRVYQKMDLYFSIDETLTYDDSRNEEAVIIPFTKDFNYYEAPTVNKDGVQVEKDPDIHFRDLAIKVIDVVPAEQTKGYYLTINSDSGHYFLEAPYDENKILTPMLKVNGKTTKCTDYDCYWFVEDSSVDVTHESYVPSGGLGWKCLNKKINVLTDEVGHKTFNYETNKYSFEVKPSDVVSKLRYKCLLIKKEIKVESIIELKNLSKPIQISLESKTGTTKYIENVGRVQLVANLEDSGNVGPSKKDKSYYVKWQRYDKNGNYLDNNFFTLDAESQNDNVYKQEISFETSKIDKANTITCSFYQVYQQSDSNEDNVVMVDQIVGTISLVITTTTGANYIVNIVNGDRLYKYDSDGDSPMESTYDGPASSGIKACDPLTFRVFKLDGTELTENEYLYCSFEWKFPKNKTLLRLKSPAASKEDSEYYYITGKNNNLNIQYTINPTYRKEYNNNNIYLSVKIGDEIVQTYTAIIFTKDGMGGTNGSKFTAEIKHNGYAYGQIDEEGVIHKFQCLYINNTRTWYEFSGKHSKDGSGNSHPLVYSFSDPQADLYFTVDVYRDASKLSSSEYTVSWSMFDSLATSPFFQINGGRLSLTSSSVWQKDTGSNDEFYTAGGGICNIIQATITIPERANIGDADGDNIEEVIYVYYPIEITKINNKNEIGDVIPSLTGGFDEVLYSSSGTDPEWNKENNFSCVDDVYNGNLDLNYEWSASANLIYRKVSDKPNTANIHPVPRFEHAITNNYVRVELKLTDQKKEEIRDERSDLEDNKAKAEEKKTKNEGLKNAILDMVKKLGYNKSIGDDGKEVDIRPYLNNCQLLLQYRYKLLTVLKETKEELKNYLVLYRNESDIPYTDDEYAFGSYNRIDVQSNIDLINEYYQNIYLLNNIDFLFNKIDESKKIEPYSNNTHYYEVSNLINIWNRFVNKYNNIIDSMIEGKVRNEDYPNFVTLKKLIYKSVDYTMTNVNKYINVMLSIKQQFINLDKQLRLEINKLDDVNGDILSYADFDNLLNRLVYLVSVYNTNFGYDSTTKTYYTDYTKNICDVEINQIQNSIVEYENKINNIDMLLTKEPELIHIKPILMHMNNTEMSYLRGWDGHKIYVNKKDGEEEYLFAPLLGAGQYSSNGTFTGITLGVRTFRKSSTSQIGMFGYNESIQTMFLNAKDGSAIFGRSGGGQIIIDPRSSQGLIYSGNYFGNSAPYGTDGKPTSLNTIGQASHTEGMLINLTDAYIHFGALSGKIYSNGHEKLDSVDPGFCLNSDGLSVGNSIRISATDTNGLVEVGKLNGKHWTIKGATDGSYSYIGYNASELAFYWDGDDPEAEGKPNPMFGSGALTGSVYLGTNGFRVGQKFAIDSEGRFCGKDGYLMGEIHATKGEIGSWKITKNAIISINPDPKTGSTVVLEADGDIYLANSPTPGDGKWKDWKFSRTGTITVDKEGSHFGGNFIIEGYASDEDAKKKKKKKASYYSSQLADIPENRTQDIVGSGSRGPFAGTCVSTIENIARDFLTGATVVDLNGVPMGYLIKKP